MGDTRRERSEAANQNQEANPKEGKKDEPLVFGGEAGVLKVDIEGRLTVPTEEGKHLKKAFAVRAV